ncbi:MAG: hypothetical protein QXL34_06535 [Thermosphaera sp.]
MSREIYIYEGTILGDPDETIAGTEEDFQNLFDTLKNAVWEMESATMICAPARYSITGGGRFVWRNALYVDYDDDHQPELVAVELDNNPDEFGLIYRRSNYTIGIEDGEYYIDYGWETIYRTKNWEDAKQKFLDLITA